MRRAEDTMALDPLGPMRIGPIARFYWNSGPMALDPLSPVHSGARPIDSQASDSKRTSESEAHAPNHSTHPDANTPMRAER